MDDTKSLSGWSTASETDRVMFTMLSNADRVDMSVLPRIEDEATPRVDEVVAEPETPPIAPSFRAEDFPPPPPVPAVDDVDLRSIPTAGQVPPPLMSDEFPPPSTPPPPSPPPPPLDEPDARPLPPSMPADAFAHHHDPFVPTSSSGKVAYENEDEKRTLLLDLQRLQAHQGVRLTKEWTMDDRLEDMMLEMRRHTLAMDEHANVNMMRDGMRLLVTGIEMVNNRIGLLDLEGWSGEVCRDLNKHDANLGRIYRKYWKRSTTTSPELDIALSIAGSMTLHHMKRTMSKLRPARWVSA